ncbi:MAG: PatB family C-S lyase [Pseudomonadaceae bacterium]|nr:PatB family C-S lyase [Pseudomonadaceae bacterium]
MPYSFDQVIDRRNTQSTKWEKFDADVLPFWVADMDFAAPELILDALRQRLEHPILGYTTQPASLTEAFQNWLRHHYSWDVPADWVCWVPGVVPALNLSARTLPSDSEIMIPTPVYHPFLDVAKNATLSDIQVPMQVTQNSSGNKWQMDLDAMTDALTPKTRMLMICNPQNPTGRCYNTDELNLLAEFIEKHDLLLVSDEIHCNILLDPGVSHQPLGKLHPALAPRTIHLYAATKVYNIPGISCAAAVIPDDKLRREFMRARAGLLPGIGPLGFLSSEVAFNDRSSWVADLMTYLRGNLAAVKACVGDRLTPLEATYLAWINVADLGLKNTETYFAQHGIGISPGAQFGNADYIRFNFACPRTTLDEGLKRLSYAINQAGTDQIDKS